MARVIDITEKLTFEGNPSLKIKGKMLEVNADAPTILKVMSFMTVSGVEIDHLNEAYELIFPEKSRKEIEKLKLNMKDWSTVVEEAMKLVMDEGNNQGEQ